MVDSQPVAPDVADGLLYQHEPQPDVVARFLDSFHPRLDGNLVSGSLGRAADLYVSFLVLKRVDDGSVLLENVLGPAHRPSVPVLWILVEMLERLAVEHGSGCALDLLCKQLLVILPAGDGIRVGHWVRAGDMQVVLNQDQVGGLVRLLEGVEGHVGRDTWRALGAGE